MHSHQQQATCGLQVCQHPLCWETNRQAARGLLDLHDDLHAKEESNIELKHSQLLIGSSSNVSHATSIHDFDEEDDFLEGLPTVTILNMIDDYGFDNRDRYPSPTFNSAADQPGGDFKPRRTVNFPHDVHVPKLALKSLASQSVDDVTAPANTPLQSSHGFGDYHTDYRDGSPHLEHSKYDSNKPIFTDATTSDRMGELGPQKKGYRKVKLEINDDKSGLKPKKMLIWCPAPRSKRGKKYLDSERKSKSPPLLKAVSLPLHSVPEFRPTPTSHKAIKGTILKRTQPHYATARKMQAVRDAATVSQPRGPSGATPQEIAQLRKVPVEILMRVLSQAEENGIISKAQTNILMAQVVGRKDKLPAIKETQKKMVDQATQNDSEEISPESVEKIPLETKNIKILNVDDVRGNSPRTVSADPVYRMDTTSSFRKLDTSPRKTAPPAPRTYSPVEPKAPVPSIEIPLPEMPTVQRRGTQDILETEDSQYDEKLRDLAEENLRTIGALPREVESPKRTPVKYVATVFDENVPPTPPIKPFHYSKSPRDIFLGPIPSPPPPSPPTERDSMYDPQIGGSTVMVNPSLTGPSTITSIGEKRSSSPSEPKTPTGRDIDGRHVKTTQTSVNGSQRRRNKVSSPYGSSTGPDGWPQINEEDYLRTAASSELACSPLPSFTEEEMRIISRNESTASPREETPLSDKFQNLQQGEIHSPAPPPPSPEPMGPGPNQASVDISPAPPRHGGAATALGLVTVTKESSLTSSETGAGATPTPVVSSDVDTPVGRVTRTQTLGSTPAIPETPYEKDSDDGVRMAEVITNEADVEAVDAKAIDETGKEEAKKPEDDFETNVSPEVVKDELEKEMEKLDLS